MYEMPVDVGPDGRTIISTRPEDDDTAAANDDEPDVFDELLRQSGAISSLQQRASAATSFVSSSFVAPVGSTPVSVVRSTTMLLILPLFS